MNAMINKISVCSRLICGTLVVLAAVGSAHLVLADGSSSVGLSFILFFFGARGRINGKGRLRGLHTPHPRGISATRMFPYVVLGKHC